MTAKILIVDDELGVRMAFSRYLTRAGYAVAEAESIAVAKAMFLKERYDAVILDLKLPDGDGIDLIPELRENSPGMAIIMVTGYGDVPLAVESMRRGADNFLIKPVDLGDLNLFLKKSMEFGALRRNEITRQRQANGQAVYFGESAVMKEVERLVSMAAESDSAVILLGETGCGKGVTARWIHEHSPRKRMPFVEINCSALRGDILASELFGHIRGAFTSAISDKQGLIELADGGTLFLDEVVEMDSGIQAQLLKVLDDKIYRRVGDTKPRRSEFRLICATNRDIVSAVANKEFRSDLYFRINVLPITIPPLRSRLEDIEGFTRLFAGDAAQISEDVRSLLRSYQWPGNIRELRNVLERAMLIAHGAPLSAAHFPGLTNSETQAGVSNSFASMEDLEREFLRSTLKQFNNDIMAVARHLGMSRSTIYRKLKNLNIPH